MPLALLADDVLVEIIGHLGLRDIYSLRLVSKQLNVKTRLRAVWSVLIICQIIEKGLPWPTYAKQLNNLPDAELEYLAVKTLRFHKIGHEGYSPLPVVTQTQRSPGSTTWMALLRSRWMVIASTDQTITIWDARCISRGAVVTWGALLGIVDTGVILQNDVYETDRIALNTREGHTHLLEVTYLSQTKSSIPSIAQVVTFSGYRTLLAGHGAWLAFGSLHGQKNAACIMDYLTGNTVTLGRHPSSWKLQQCLTIYLDPTFIFVARFRGIEVYSTARVSALIHEKGSILVPLEHILYPFQQGQFPWGIQIFGPSRAFHGNDNVPWFTVSVRCPQFIVHLGLRQASSSPQNRQSSFSEDPPKFEWLSQPLSRIALDPLGDGSEFIATLCATTNGPQYAWTQGDEWSTDELSVYSTFTEVDYTNNIPAIRPKLLWKPPARDIPDLPHVMAFDANSGIVVLAMASGAVIVLDFVPLQTDVDTSSENAVIPYYRWGGLGCADTEPHFPNDGELISIEDEWVLVYRLIEPEDPLPPLLGYPPWAPPLSTVGLDQTVVNSWPEITRLDLPEGWTNDWCSLEEHQWESLYYGHEGFQWTQVHLIAGVPIPLARNKQDGTMIVYVDGYFMRSIIPPLDLDDVRLIYLSFKTTSLEDILRYMGGELELETDREWSPDFDCTVHKDNYLLQQNWVFRRQKMCEHLDGDWDQVG